MVRCCGPPGSGGGGPRVRALAAVLKGWSPTCVAQTPVSGPRTAGTMPGRIALAGSWLCIRGPGSGATSCGLLPKAKGDKWQG
eukprot:6004754-Heterocapsa_arctica.AAC.1